MICVLEFTVYEVAKAVPNRTAETPAKPVPVTVTLVPPRADPEVGEMELTVGAASSFRVEEAGERTKRLKAGSFEGWGPGRSSSERPAGGLLRAVAEPAPAGPE